MTSLLCYPDRPRPWFGPDDYFDGRSVEDQQATRDRQIKEWDANFAALPWFRRVFITYLTDTRIK